MSCPRLGFIGMGNMASALLLGLLKSDYIIPSHINIYDVLSEKTDKYSTYGVVACESHADVVAQSDILFLCIKPQKALEVLESIRTVVRDGQCIVSIMAGITIDTIVCALGRRVLVIRSMPNTPLLLGQGATALTRGIGVDDDLFSQVLKVFSLSGVTVETTEDHLSAVTALSGSGPAYFFKFARAALQEAESLGLAHETALTLLAQTMIGSAKMLTDSGKDPDELIRMVTSPKGTTQAASEVFDAGEYEPLIRSAMRACAQRAEELGRGE